MKKYIAPALELQETETFELMALSKLDDKADGSEVLSREEDWNIWEDEAE